MGSDFVFVIVAGSSIVPDNAITGISYKSEGNASVKPSCAQKLDVRAMRNTVNSVAFSTTASPRRIDAMQSLNKTNASLLAPHTRVSICKRARSLARIKVSAFGAGDRGFKSHRARHFLGSS